MTCPADIAQRHARVLSELAELGLDLARDLKARAEAAQSVEDAERLAEAFHRVSRSVRLTLALEVRLGREGHELWIEARKRRVRAVELRTDQVRAEVVREVWRETEGEVAERLIEDLDEVLVEQARYEAFLEAPVEAVVARIRQDLGLPANDATQVNPPLQSSA